MDLPTEKVTRNLKNCSRTRFSLENQPIGEEENDSHLGDFIEDQWSTSPAENAGIWTVERTTWSVLDTLNGSTEKCLTFYVLVLMMVDKNFGKKLVKYSV